MATQRTLHSDIEEDNRDMHEHSEAIQVLRVRQRVSSEENIRLPELEGLGESYQMQAQSSGSPFASNIFESTDGVNEQRLSEFPLYISQQETAVGTERELTSRSDSSSSYNEQGGKFRFIRVRDKSRSQSAPARPLTELEEMRSTIEFECLQFAAVNARQFAYTRDGKLNFESLEGFYHCSRFLEATERLAELLDIKPLGRTYRCHFSQPYRLLYRSFEEFGYLAEVVESAQERLPFIIVNGEKYIFSANVLCHGENLLLAFAQLRDHIMNLFGNFFDETLKSPDISKRMLNFRKHLIDFDKKWVSFEKAYIFELMLIEKDARRFLSYAIEIERKMTDCELAEKLKGSIVIRSSTYKLLRKRFVEVCGRINSVANYVGKGRDDLSADILAAAENVLRRVSDYRSKAVRKLASKIKETFNVLRLIFRKYAENIEMINPELSSNQDLVEALADFEKAWEKGKSYLLDPSTTKMLVGFSEYIEELTEKYLSLIHICRCRRYAVCRSRWSPYH
eukprot:TRINITY_DN13405_c0_g1_i14.p1 TRINITY_DN13405_c0_g1~~TRINITY_DN13405_c0_g1_i14.p1  ORF type:complete len:509 (-),score=101.70 TRINITY_DN13405_c0_g1_i14:20-1546(-)